MNQSQWISYAKRTWGWTVAFARKQYQLAALGVRDARPYPPTRTVNAFTPARGLHKREVCDEHSQLANRMRRGSFWPRFARGYARIQMARYECRGSGKVLAATLKARIYEN